jgi:hypothetical protein
VTFAFNTRSEHEVDEIISDLKSKDVTILKPPQKAFWEDIMPTSPIPMGIPGRWLSIHTFHLINQGI